MIAPPNSAPTLDSERIVAIDILRGFALLGILVMNIQGFAMIDAVYMNPTAVAFFGGQRVPGLGAKPPVCRSEVHDDLLAVVRSWDRDDGPIVSRPRDVRPPSLHYRRMGWLLVIGLIHAYFIWYGDILYTYAVCGAGVFLLRRLPPWLLVIFGILSLSVASGYSVMVGFSIPYWPEEQLRNFELENWAPPAEAIEEQLMIYRGSWPWATSASSRSIVLHADVCVSDTVSLASGRIDDDWDRTLPLGSVDRPTFQYLLYGDDRHRDVGRIPFDHPGCPRQFRRRLGREVLVLPRAVSTTIGAVSWSALAYIGAIMLASKNLRLATLLWPLAAVGQMALTNYLLHSIICTMIFYGHGLGQFGHFSRVQQLSTVIGIWVFQLIVSPIWLHYFRFGPFEWLWRSLSYWRWQPIRR